MIVLGLTGSVGMGKSATAQMMREAGVPVFDADAIVHQLYAGKAASLVEAAFPGVVHDGVVDRAALGRHVLADTAALKRLEALIHPLVAAERQQFLDEHKTLGTPIVVLDVPLLFETGANATVDTVVVVTAAKAVQKARVMARPGMTEARFSAILAKQMPDAEKRRRADYLIETDGGFEAARRQVEAILAAVRAG